MKTKLLNGILAAGLVCSLALGFPAPTSTTMINAMPGMGKLLEKQTLSLDAARTVINGAVAFAKKNNTTGVIAVVDDGGNLMAVERIDGTFAAGANISIGKARTAALFKKPTKFFEDVIKNGRTAMTALNDFTPLQGGIPIMIDGEIVGGVGVSGASSAQQDEELAIAGANALTNSDTMQSAAMAEVVYFAGDKVSAAFAKGMPLIENDEFKIHASRREKPGMAEVHSDDTDLIYVVDGSSTFVTGGMVVDGKTTAAGEIRGMSISGGETRTLNQGDVIIVPRGVPHWFKDVSGTFIYYTVKVTG